MAYYLRTPSRPRTKNLIAPSQVFLPLYNYEKRKANPRWMFDRPNIENKRVLANNFDLFEHFGPLN